MTTGRTEQQQHLLAELIREAQEHPAGPDYPAGPTTDPATVADRLLRTGLVRVRTPLLTWRPP